MTMYTDAEIDDRDRETTERPYGFRYEAGPMQTRQASSVRDYTLHAMIGELRAARRVPSDALALDYLCDAHASARVWLLHRHARRRRVGALLAAEQSRFLDRVRRGR